MKKIFIILFIITQIINLISCNDFKNKIYGKYIGEITFNSEKYGYKYNKVSVKEMINIKKNNTIEIIIVSSTYYYRDGKIEVVDEKEMIKLKNKYKIINNEIILEKPKNAKKFRIIDNETIKDEGNNTIYKRE